MPTPRDVVRQALRFENPSRIPRQTWILPIAEDLYGKQIQELRHRWPDDIVKADCPYRPSSIAQGNPFSVGTYVDEWGCEFLNAQAGVIGEVKNAVVSDTNDLEAVQPPYEILPESPSARDEVNRFCASTDRFTMSGCCLRPWERMQFLRGTADAMMDVMVPEDGGASLLKKIHDFYCMELEFWVYTDVDSVMFMDDWGSQRQLLIPPAKWRELFKPLYRDYCEMAHSNGKFVFMHSDGNIREIYEDLVEVGVDAINSQLFTMDLADLATRVKGQITFWGEIDRQHVLPDVNAEKAREAVCEVATHLYDPAGGIIAQFELGPAARIENAFAIHEQWDEIESRTKVP